MKQVLLTMRVDGKPVRQQLGLRSALQEVIDKSLCRQVDNVTIKSGRAAV